MNNKKIILFDIDYTLFDTTKFKKLVAEEIASIIHFPDKGFYELLEEVYYKARFDNHFEPSLFPASLQEKVKTAIHDERIKSIWFDKDLIKKALYPEAVRVLQELQTLQIPCGIFSTGNTEFQLAKISSLEDMLRTSHIHIFSNKDEKLSELLQDYRDYSLFLVDDFLSILEKGKKAHPDITTVWMKRGKFAEKVSLPTDFVPDATIMNLEELLPLVDKQ